MGTRRILINLIRVLIIGVMLLGASIALTLFVMARKDKEHERFFNTGKSVNTFLASYKHGLEESFKKKDVKEIMKFYSDRYASPGRGRWILQPDPKASDVACFDLKADGRKDYAKPELKDETEDYLNSLTAVDDVKLKIDVIEAVEDEKTVQLTVKFILDGKDRQGQIFQ